MEISIKDIFKAIIKKWYIFFSIISIFLAIGTGIAVNNYNQPKYTSSSTFLFSNLSSSSSVSLYVSDCRAYLDTDYIKYTVKDAVDETYPDHNGYQVNISTLSSTLTIGVTADNEELTIFVLEQYSEVISSENNPILTSGLVIENLVPYYSREEKASIMSLGMQIILFAFIGLFISGVIILTPLYNEKAKEQRINRIIEEYKEKLKQENSDITL